MKEEPYFITYANFPLTTNRSRHVEDLEKFFQTAGYRFHETINVNNLLKIVKDNKKLPIEHFPPISGVSDRHFHLFRTCMEDIVKNVHFEKVSMFPHILESANFFTINESFYIINGDIKMDRSLILDEERLWRAGYFDDLLFALACFNLVDFLSKGNLKKIKKCSICGLLFTARDAKRKICYEDKCFRDYKRIQKKRQRDINPVKYT